MNNTRRIKMFIGAMMVAAAITAGYATVMSHTLHAYFALAVLVLAAVTSRMKVKLPGMNGNMSVNLPFLLTAVVSLSAAEAVVVTLRIHSGAMLAAQGCEVQPAADGVQHEHDGVCQLPREPDVPCAVVAWSSAWFHNPRTGAGNSDSVPGTDRSGGCDRSRERGQSGWADLVEPGATLVPVLRRQRGSHHDGSGSQFAHGLGPGSRGIPDHVRDPPLLPHLLQRARRNAASADSGSSGERRGINDQLKMNGGKVASAAEPHDATFFLW